MATKKKINAPIVTDIEVDEEVKTEPVEEIKKEEIKKEKNKYKIGSIVYISKDADADLNGFKIFPQYKKYTYTVEAYDEKSGVYSLRKLNLLLKLKEDLILSPNEKSSNPIDKVQF